jgi:hypothetical protein
MGNSATPVLKGLHNLAQGNALGRRIDKRIVREKMSIEKKFPFRTKQMISFLGHNMFFYSLPAAGRRPKEGFPLENHVLADGFILYSNNPGRCPGLKQIGLSGRKKMTL